MRGHHRNRFDRRRDRGPRGPLPGIPVPATPSHNHKRHGELVSALQERGLKLAELRELIDLRIAMRVARAVRNSFGEVIG